MAVWLVFAHSLIKYKPFLVANFHSHAFPTRFKRHSLFIKLIAWIQQLQLQLFYKIKVLKEKQVMMIMLVAVWVYLASRFDSACSLSSSLSSTLSLFISLLAVFDVVVVVVVVMMPNKFRFSGFIITPAKSFLGRVSHFLIHFQLVPRADNRFRENKTFFSSLSLCFYCSSNKTRRWRMKKKRTY